MRHFQWSEWPRSPEERKSWQSHSETEYLISCTLPFDAPGRERERADRRDNLVGAKTAIPFVRPFPPSLLSTSGNDSPLFPSLSAALIADRSSVQGRRPPSRVRRASESVDRTCFERSALDDAGNDGAGREGGRADTIFARLKQVTQAEEASFHFGDDQSRTSPGMFGDLLQIKGNPVGMASLTL